MTGSQCRNTESPSAVRLSIDRRYEIFVTLTASTTTAPRSTFNRTSDVSRRLMASSICLTVAGVIVIIGDTFMDLISREAARKAVSMADAARKVVSQSQPGREWFDIGIATPVTAVENTPDGWISVDERLPEKGSICLVCGKNGGMRVARASYCEPLDLWTVVGTGKPFKAAYWMELPSPPAE